MSSLVLYGMILTDINPVTVLGSKTMKQISDRDGYVGHLFFPKISDIIMLMFDHINDVKMLRNHLNCLDIPHDEEVYECSINEDEEVEDIKRVDDVPPYNSYILQPDDGTLLSNYLQTAAHEARKGHKW